MDKYDFKILLEQAYKEGLTKEGITPEALDNLRNAIERDKPNIDSVFGVGYPEEFEGELIIFLSDANTWKNEGHCADQYYDDAADILDEIGFCHEMDGHFSRNPDLEPMTKEEIITKLSSIGFEYDSNFEEFMLDV